MKRLPPSWLGTVIFMLAFLIQCGHAELYFRYSGHDRNQQLVSADLFLKGKGFGLVQADPNDLSQAQLRPIQGWPPGYALIAAGFYKISGNWFVGIRWMNIVAICLIFIALYFLVKRIASNTNPWLPIFVFGYLCFSFSPFHYIFSSGKWALAFFLWGILFLDFSFHQQGNKWKWRMLGILFLVLSPWIRYVYLPLILLVPACFLLLSGWRAEKQTILLSGLTGLISLVALFFFQTPTHSDGESIWQILASGNFFWEHLLRIDAVPLKSLAYFSLEGLLNHYPGLTLIQFLLKTGLVIGSVTLIIILFQYQIKRPEKFQSAYFLACCFGLAYALLSLLLILLSLLRPAEIHDGLYTWTFVQESRYYAPAMLGFLLFSLDFALIAPKSWPRKLMRILLIATFFYSTIHRIQRTMQWSRGDMRETRWAGDEKLLKQLCELSHQEIEKGKKPRLIYEDWIFAEDAGNVVTLCGGLAINRTLLGTNPDLLDPKLSWWYVKKKSDPNSPQLLTRYDANKPVLEGENFLLFKLN